MAEVYHDAQAVHLADYFAAKGADAMVAVLATCGVTDVVVAIVAQCHIDDATLGKVAQVVDAALDGMAVLDTEHDALLALVLVQPQIVGGAGNGHMFAMLGRNGFYLVEDFVSVLLRMLVKWHGLWQVRHHDGSVLMTLVHLVKVDEELWVATAEIDMLGEEHGCVAVRVERQHTTMDVAGAAVLLGLANKPLEDGQTIVQALGVPLYTQDGLVLRALHGLYDAVVRTRYDTEARTWVVDSLVVEGVDEEPPPILLLKEGGNRSRDMFRNLIYIIEEGVLFNGDVVGGDVARFLLRVVVTLYVADVLTDVSTKRHGQRLDATTDTEDGQLAVVGQLGDEEFGEVALGIDGTQLRPRFFASIVRVVVCTSAEDDSVEVFQGVDDDIRIAQRRNDNGCAASTHDGLIVAFCQFAGQFAIIARNANDGLVGSFRK